MLLRCHILQVLHRLKDAGLVQEFNAPVDDKVLLMFLLVYYFMPSMILSRPYQFPETDMVTRHDFGDLMLSRPINQAIRSWMT
jgi:hypothetical protein